MQIDCIFGKLEPCRLKKAKACPLTLITKYKRGALPTGYPKFDPPFENFRYFAKNRIRLN